MMATWMADVLRAGGLQVREVPGWETRGHGQLAEIRGVLLHHTAGPAQGLFPSERTVIDGRPGLDGPLCNLGLQRDGVWVTVAAGLAWHAGVGWHRLIGSLGNPYLLGVEAESTGRTDDWTDAQRLSYPHGVAVLLSHLGLPAARAIGHKEWALPAGRKIDPAFWDMTSFRRDVAGWMRNGPAQPLTLKPPPPKPSPNPASGGATSSDTLPHLQRGATGPSVSHLQAFMRGHFPLYAGSLPVTGNFLSMTDAVIREFQSRVTLTPDGVVGPATNAQLWRFGYRG